MSYMNTKKSAKKRQSGQFMIEAVLLMVLFLGIATVIKRSFNDQAILGKLVAEPWSAVAGMMSNGVWKPEAQGRDLHPQGNVVSREGDTK